MKLSPFLFLLASIIVLLAGCTSQLEKDFKNPLPQFKPRTWMHAMSGNMTKEGLTKDFESMEKVGIGGVLLFNIAQGIPYGPVQYNSDKHHELIQHAAKECERLGLSFGVHNCDGWSSSGGPWITPEQSMKMVVWSETVVDGGENLSVQLGKPTTREGFYRDIAVLAYPSLDAEVTDAEVISNIVVSDKSFNTSLVNDLRIDSFSTLKQNGDELPWILYDYGKPHTIRSAYVVCNDRNGEILLQASADGKTFSDVQMLEKGRTGKSEWVHFGNFEPLTARYFRLQPSQTMTFKEARLSAVYSINNVFGRTMMARTEDSKLKPLGTPETSMVIQKDLIRDVSSGMNPEGELKTSLPEGKWTILRFGYTSTGAVNSPASDAGRGLECDKLSREAFKTHYDAFVARVVKETGPLAPNALQYVEIDSYEMGGQNWTNDFETIFKDTKGYDLTSFLPLFSGRFVESAESTEAVCSDLREVICNLMTENYYGYFTELCHQDGLKSYIEPYGFGPVNDLDVGGKTDIPMGEFWMNRPLTQVKSSISSAHIYGKNVVSAESFTTEPGINWKGHPGMAKITGDRAWAAGINEFMFHRYTHQANTHVKPGMTMNRWGFHFDRTQTWWENAGKAWFEYIARGSYLLRQGVPVADFLVFIGDGAPNSIVEREEMDPAFPEGINYDCVNRDVLLHRISIKNKKLVLPEGTEYKVLLLQNCDRVSLETLKRIHELAMAGIPVAGKKPKSLTGYNPKNSDVVEFEKLVAEIWSNTKTYPSANVTEIMEKENLIPDFQIAGRTDIGYAHRKTEKEDIYFLYNPDSLSQRLECSFRVTDKIPELWDARTGEIRKSGQFLNSGATTKVWIDLDAEESVFVVFRETAKNVKPVSDPEVLAKGSYFLNSKNQLIIEENIGSSPVTIDGNWEVEFLKEHDYPGVHQFENLTDWKDHPDENINYYSGTAVYRKTFSWNEKVNPENQKTDLDLGEVKIVAEVFLNGQNMGVAWKKPYKLDITNALKSGENQLEIRVTNQWSNRLIGDERFPKQDDGYRLSGNPPAANSKMPGWYTNNQPMPGGPRTTFCTG